MTILDKTRNFITRYVALPDEAYADILALYVIHTHAFDAARTTPYIYINSAEKQSGKTRLLETLEAICRNPQLSANMSPATMYRIIEAGRPTIMVDEVDTIYSGSKNDDLRGVLNSGYKHNGNVMRVDPTTESGVATYSTFSPKVLAGIDNGMVPDTVMDRSIVITLRRVARGTIDYFDAEDVEVEAAELQAELSAWVGANMDKLTDRELRPARIEDVSDRANDISRPLLYIAQNFPGWNKRARIALHKALGPEEVKLSPQGECLSAVRDYMHAHNLDAIASAKVVELVNRSGKQVAIWFKAYNIPTGKFVTIDGENVRGYHREDFVDAWNRYLPAFTDTTETTQTEGA